MNLNELATRAYETAEAKGWHNPPPSIPEQLALVHSEVSEALEAFRVGDDGLRIADNGKPEGMASELADVIIRVGHIAKRLGIDLDSAVETKMNYNDTRPFRHGGKRL